MSFDESSSNLSTLASDVSSDGKFDIAKFNKEFIKKAEKTKLKSEVKSKEKLKKLTESANYESKSIYQLSVMEILINIKNTWFHIFDDILAKNISIKTIMGNDRPFYVGITIVIIATILYIYNFFMYGDSDDDNTTINTNAKQVTIEKHYIYGYDGVPNGNKGPILNTVKEQLIDGTQKKIQNDTPK